MEKKRWDIVIGVIGDGLFVNADVNGAINIARKSKVTAIQFNTVKQIKGVLDHPLRIRLLQTS